MELRLLTRTLVTQDRATAKYIPTLVTSWCTAEKARAAVGDTSDRADKINWNRGYKRSHKPTPSLHQQEATVRSCEDVNGTNRNNLTGIQGMSLTTP